jgi:ADP-heptose:LPS heptosyltransferase
MSAAALPSLADFRSALIVKPSSLGDIVHTLPAVHAIRQAYPELKLRWLANTEWCPLIQETAWLDEVIPFPRKTFRGVTGLLKARRWAQKTLPTQSEIVLDFQGLFRSALLARASGSRPIVGLSDSREAARFLHDHIVPVDPGAHAVERYLRLPQAFGIPIAADKLSFPLAAGSAPKNWPQRDDLIVVHPWSRGAGKSLSDEALQALCDSLAPHPVVLVGMSETKTRPSGDHITDFSHRTTLPELIWVLRKARWVISVDSGPMHIAAGVNDRTLGIHTWSDPRKVGPYNPRAWTWKAGRIAHRKDFTPAESTQERSVTIQAAEQIAAFVIQQIRYCDTSQMS